MHHYCSGKDVIPNPLHEHNYTTPYVPVVKQTTSPSDQWQIAITCHRKATCNGSISQRSCVTYDKIRIGKSRQFRVRYSTPVKAVTISISAYEGPAMLQLSHTKLIRQSGVSNTLQYANENPQNNVPNEFSFFMHPKKENLTNLKTLHFLTLTFVLGDGSIVRTSINNIRVAGHK